MSSPPREARRARRRRRGRAPTSSAASVTARYIAPESRYVKPSRRATSRATVLLPLPAGPSIAMIIGGSVEAELYASCFAAPWRCAVGACLGTVSAHLHRAPGGRAVARAVVERPLARVRAAGLQPLPGAVGHRLVDEPDRLAERAVDARAAGLQRGLAVAAEAHLQGTRAATARRRSSAARSSRRRSPLLASSSRRSARAGRSSAPSARVRPRHVGQPVLAQPGARRRRRRRAPRCRPRRPAC